jgi:anti-sigma factor RsiW
MKPQLSPKDWQQISEYLDDQLSPKEKNRLEERIRIRPELREGLEELQHTRVILRSVPKRRAPHNFTLTPEMVRPRSISRLFPVLSFSSALATVLIVVTLVFRLLPGVSVSSASQVQRFAAPAAPAAPAIAPVSPFTSSSAQNPAADAQTSPTPEIITWGQQQNKMSANSTLGFGGGPGQPASPSKGAAPLVAPGVIEAQPSQEAPLQALPPAASSPLATPEPALAQPNAQVLAVPTNKASPASGAATLKRNSPILGIPARSEQGKILPEPTAEPTVVEAAAPEPNSQAFPYWILFEAALAVIAVVTGLAAYSLWRKAKM